LPLNLSLAKEEVIHYYESGNFEQECKESIDEALLYFKEHECSFTEKKTIIFDIDDTALSWFTTLKDIDFCLNCGVRLFNELAAQADMPLNMQVKRLYDYCVAQSYSIIFFKRETR
jgi:HAD superfamily, subfamily IIIB (Acid phosphatase)